MLETILKRVKNNKSLILDELKKVENNQTAEEEYSLSINALKKSKIYSVEACKVSNKVNK